MEQVILGPRNRTNGFMMPRRCYCLGKGQFPGPPVLSSSEYVVSDQVWSIYSLILLVKLTPDPGVKAVTGECHPRRISHPIPLAELLKGAQLWLQLQQQPRQREVNQTVSFKSFQSVKPLEFKGGVDSVAARIWLKEMEKAFTLTQWESTRALEGEGPVSWARTKRSVAKYEAKFRELARLVPVYVSTEAQKAKRFQQGLKPGIHSGVVALQLKTYPSVVQAALVIESDQKLAFKEMGDKKQKSEGITGETNPGGSSQRFQKRFGQNRNKRFRRKNFPQARATTTSVASTPA
ncbi:hypothetical protein AgCh_034922 [Apium graveolens]